LTTTTERDITERERAQQEIALARELALAIGTAERVDDAMQLTLCKICETTGWTLGEAWVRYGEELVLSSVWHEGTEGLERFERGLTQTTTTRGVGLPGHAWVSKKPIWMRDVTGDPRFLRGSLAQRFGLGAAMAVPVLSDDEVVAVLMFLVTEPRDEDEHLIGLVSTVGAQLGALIRRKQAEEAHRRSEQQLRAIADTAVDAIVSADADGNIVYFNKAAERIFGYRAEEVIGRPIKILMPDRFKPAHEQGFARFLATGEQHVIGSTVELSALRKDGSEFPVELALSSWEAGGDQYFTGMLRDITERRGAEETLRQSDRLKTALLRSVSHDLRSPLTAIVAAGESSASPGLDLDGRRELASVIVSEGNRLSKLVDKLLDLSKLQSGVAVPRRVACSIEEIVNSAIEHLAGDYELFEIELDEDLPSVHADAAQLERALANLLENARRYSDGEPVRVAAEVSGENMTVSVTDHGPGIPAADRELVFEPFHRGADASGSHQGSGLGLAIVKGFVEANGGSVRAEPAAGGGTSFVVTLPLRRFDRGPGPGER
jgi:PAS domain S-box-containing protein